MFKHKIRILFFRKISVFTWNLGRVGTVNEFKSIYKILKRGEGESKKN